MLRVIVMLSAFALPLTELTARLLVLLACRLRLRLGPRRQRVLCLVPAAIFAGMCYVHKNCSMRAHRSSLCKATVRCLRSSRRLACAKHARTGTGKKEWCALADLLSLKRCLKNRNSLLCQRCSRPALRKLLTARSELFALLIERVCHHSLERREISLLLQPALTAHQADSAWRR